jgi:hypothetical protein
MKSFTQYLHELDKLKKEKKFNEAWKLANDAMFNFVKQGDEYWYDFYYQMADIAAREKKWENALFHMGLVVHYNKGVGGASHTKFIIRLLKKFKKEALFDDFIKLSLVTKSENIRDEMKDLLNK